MGSTRITIHFSQEAQIALLNDNVKEITFSSEYLDFIDIFSSDSAAELL